VGKELAVTGVAHLGGNVTRRGYSIPSSMLNPERRIGTSVMLDGEMVSVV
jgi:hypothetical protein